MSRTKKWFLEVQTSLYDNRGIKNPKEKAELVLQQWEDFIQARKERNDDEKYHEDCREAETLMHTMLGYMLTQNTYDLSTNRINVPCSAKDFWDSKRPYGNKDVEESIIYKLNWGTYQMREGFFPDFVRAEAERIHQLVIVRLEETEKFLKQSL